MLLVMLLRLNKNVPVTGTFRKEDKMKEEYISLFEEIKKSYPKHYKEKINEYMQCLEKTVNNNALLKINILACFKEDQNKMYEIFPDIYSKYEFTGFRISKLEEVDVTVICESYISEVYRIGGEFVNDI